MLTKRARRAARKLVAKPKEVYLYRMNFVSDNRPTERLLKRWAFVDVASQDRFSKNWDSLTDSQKSRVMESINHVDSQPRLKAETEALRYDIGAK